MSRTDVAATRYLPPRNSQLWLLLSLSLCMVPLALELPLWLIAVWGLVVFWRWQIFRGRWSVPNTPIKTLLVFSSGLGLWLSYGRFQGLEPMASLLVLALLLKWLEQQRLRDTLVVVYLGFVMVALQFLFGQTLLISLYAAVCVWLLLAALLALYQPQGHLKPARTARLAGRLLLHALPLMLLMFLVMPRLGSLWAVPSPSHSARSGMSDSMAPGDFSRLSKSGGVAFRVDFDGPKPPQEQLYWRGLVFSDFDGRRWRQAPTSRDLNRYSGEASVVWGRARLNKAGRSLAWQSASEALAESVDYRITLEPTQQRWVYSLPVVTDFRSESAAAGLRLGLSREQYLLAQEPVRVRSQYSVSSVLSYRWSPEALTAFERRRVLGLPSDFNPQTQARAELWRQQADSDSAYVERVLAHYRASFVYTLEPPRLGRDSVDEFLWRDLDEGGQQGFCEHFASSFVVMMRAAQIPARVVVGYMGGEYNEQGDYLVVHQYDAHAWAEVWLPGEGWTRVDPTAAVAPERVRQSLGELQLDGVDKLLSLGRYRNFAWVSQLRMQWDGLNYAWHKAVMGFDSERQGKLLTDLLGGVSPLKMVLLVLGSGASFLALISLHLWWRNCPPRPAPLLHVFVRFERLLARKGLERLPGETPGIFARRAQQHWPQSAPAIGRFIKTYQRAQYGAVGEPQWNRGLAQDLSVSLAVLRRQLKKQTKLS